MTTVFVGLLKYESMAFIYLKEMAYCFFMMFVVITDNLVIGLHAISMWVWPKCVCGWG